METYIWAANVGQCIGHCNENITLNQIDYISSIQSIQVSRNLQMWKQQICDNEKSTKYCQLIGKLNWIANQNRPDIYFDTCHLSLKMKSPTKVTL